MDMGTTPDVSLGNRKAPLSRWKASGIHLLLSAGIAGALVAVMLLVWYPWPLFEVAGGSGLIMILVGVDVVLGPLITLVIFKAGKKGLKFDLAVIASLQLAALAYGVHAVYVVRPVYMVYNIDRFNLVAAIDLDPADLAAAKREEFRRLPVDGPHYIAAIQPDGSARAAEDSRIRARRQGRALVSPTVRPLCAGRAERTTPRPGHRRPHRTRRFDNEVSRIEGKEQGFGEVPAFARPHDRRGSAARRKDRRSAQDRDRRSVVTRA